MIEEFGGECLLLFLRATVSHMTPSSLSLGFLFVALIDVQSRAALGSLQFSC